MGGGYREPPKRKFWLILVDHSLPDHRVILKSHHLSLILLPGMITVQYLPSSHIQIKVVCTVRSIKLVTFMTLVAGTGHHPTNPESSFTKTPRGGFEGPAPRAAAREVGFVSRAWGLCHFHFSKDGLSASSRNQTPSLGKAGGALAGPGR